MMCNNMMMITIPPPSYDIFHMLQGINMSQSYICLPPYALFITKYSQICCESSLIFTFYVDANVIVDATVHEPASPCYIIFSRNAL